MTILASLSFRRACIAQGQGFTIVSQRVCRPPIPSVSMNDVDDAIRSFISVGADDQELEVRFGVFALQKLEF
ncbi:unnamed protein product [Rhizoctonia solani]|uniref:Uncharacterized protein n=1 Tax=Rhizoctonia solani TaxID=456999 RepID=A0A8H3DWL1_9AGAM|nr:unnamed protein product [Rhizoctonia solani]